MDTNDKKVRKKEGKSKKVAKSKKKPTLAVPKPYTFV